MGAPSPAYTPPVPPVSGPSQRGAWEKFIEGVVAVLKCSPLYLLLIRYHIKLFFISTIRIIIVGCNFLNIVIVLIFFLFWLINSFLNLFCWILGYSDDIYFGFWVWGLPVLLFLFISLLLILYFLAAGVRYWRSAFWTAKALKQQPAGTRGVKLVRIDGPINHPGYRVTFLLWEAVEVTEDQYGRAWERARPYIKPTVWAALGTALTGYAAPLLLVAAIWLLWPSNLPRLLHTLEGHWGEVSGVAVSGDGRVVVSGGKDGKVLVWKVPQ